MRDHDRGRGLIILDESTRALTGDDLERIHAMLRRIAADGSAALMISHNLTELMAVTDRITDPARRAGRGRGPAHRGALSEQDIARRMLGGTVEAVAHREDRPARQRSHDHGTRHAARRSP